MILHYLKLIEVLLRRITHTLHVFNCSVCLQIRIFPYPSLWELTCVNDHDVSGVIFNVQLVQFESLLKQTSVRDIYKKRLTFNHVR